MKGVQLLVLLLQTVKQGTENFLDITVNCVLIMKYIRYQPLLKMIEQQVIMDNCVGLLISSAGY